MHRQRVSKATLWVAQLLAFGVGVGLVASAVLSSSATATAEGGWVTSRTGFTVRTHGWPFENQPRVVCAAPTCKDEHWASFMRPVLTFRWALCGGMSLSALRRFRDGRPVEAFSPQVKKELVTAQLETVSGTVWRKFIEWQAKPNQPHILAAHTIGYSTKQEWPSVRRAIDRGAPMILGLIREGPTGDIRKVGGNHQVLAIGYRWNESTKDLQVEVYDPNHKNNSVTLSMNFGLSRNQINARQSSGEPLRGFFAIPVGSGRPASGAEVMLSTGASFGGAQNWTAAGYGQARNGWYAGDFNGDGKDDIFRYMPGSSGAEVLLSAGTSFAAPQNWTGAGYGQARNGWYVGDFNGDGKDDIFRYMPGNSGAEVLLSTGTSFAGPQSWTAAGYGDAPNGWYVGDFDGDGKDDILRYVRGRSGAEVLLSTGTSFAGPQSWTGAGYGDAPNGWYVGDFNGDGKDDIFRYMLGSSGAEVMLSTGTSFAGPQSWTGAGYGDAPNGWYIGDFDGDGKDDIFRYILK